MTVSHCIKKDKWLEYYFVTTYPMNWEDCVSNVKAIYEQMNTPEVSVASMVGAPFLKVEIKESFDILKIPSTAAIEIKGKNPKYDNELMFFRLYNQSNVVLVFIEEEYIKNFKKDETRLLNKEEQKHIFDVYMDSIELNGHAQQSTLATIEKVTKGLTDCLCDIDNFKNIRIYQLGRTQCNLSKICEKIVQNFQQYMNEINEEIEQLKATLPKQPVFKITFTDDECTYLNSKVGGSFFWNEDNLPEFSFLAQINFEELPENNIFPKTGMLQFFIKDSDSDSYGLFDEDGYRVIYHKNLHGHECKNQQGELSLIEKVQKMEFTLTEELMSSCDYRFEEYIKKFDNIPFNSLPEELTGDGSKLLGFPFFTQGDIRYGEEKYNTLLFQIDSYQSPTEWGDGGVCNFFINDKNLKNHDFSGVLYNWDCY